MPAYRCSVCDLAFPVLATWLECPECGLKTRYEMGTKPMPPEELQPYKDARAEAKKAATAKPTDEQVAKLRAQAEHYFITQYEYALHVSAQRNASIGRARWTPQDVLEELHDQQAQQAAGA